MAAPSIYNMVAMAFILFLVQLGMAEDTQYHVQSLFPSTKCSSSLSRKEINGSSHTSLIVMHRYGPCYPGSEKLNHKQILDQDRSRVAALQHRHAIEASLIPVRTGVSLGTGNYIVTIGFGTPAKEYSVVIDTGSDVTWIQCKPCVGYCYQQQEPIFDPSQSSTYANVSCSSPYCSEVYPSSCSSSTCVYTVRYGDNSSTTGFYASDTLSLSSTDVFPGFRFGCGEKNQGLFGKAAGLLGLGRRATSFVSQTSTKNGGFFAYCLPVTSSSVGYLDFGRKNYDGVRYTMLLSNPARPSFYFLNLVSILVGGKPLPILPTVFSTGGTLIDSGTVITRLPPDAYSALKTEFSKGMSQYPKAPALSILDTCYNLTGKETVTVPTIAFRFGDGGTMNITFAGILYAASVSQVCLAFAANDNALAPTIIGNVQQRKLNVVYDVAKSMLGFGPGSC